MAQGATTIETFRGDFERVRAALPGAGAPWLDAMRRGAIDTLGDRGLPTVRDEDWKYTSVTPLLRERLAPVLPTDPRPDAARVAALVASAPGAAAAEVRLVFVDGCFDRRASALPTVAGLAAASLRERLAAGGDGSGAMQARLAEAAAAAGRGGFAALNTAFLDDGAVLEITAGVDTPVHVVCVSTARDQAFVAHPRHSIVVADGAHATVVEHFVGEDGARYLANAFTQVVLGRGSRLAHVRVQDDAREAFHVSRIEVRQERDSTFDSVALGLGARLSRTEISVVLAGEEAACRLAGLYAMDGQRHVDHHLSIDHAAPRTTSSQLYKGVLDDRSRGVFTGKVLVRAGSQKIRATQHNPSLLLGRGAVAETRPQLEILADDVACNHGATIGRLDEDALFYLRARGIGPAEARRILVSGFASSVVGGVAHEGLRADLAAAVDAHVAGLGAAAGRVEGAAS